MKISKIFLLLGATALLLSVGAAEKYKRLPAKDKAVGKDLTFAVTFDSYSTLAEFARGEKASTTLSDVSFLLRGVVGFDMQQGYQPLPGESLCYRSDKNVDFRKGTLSMWAKAVDYSPGVKDKRGNISYAQLRFEDGKNRFVQYLLYEYGGNLYWDWYSSEPPHGYSDVGRVVAPLAAIRKGEWFNVTVTWDKELSIYVNGKAIHSAMLPAKVSKTADLKPDLNKSFIGIKNGFYRDEHKNVTQVDDVKIYSRPFTALEVANAYNSLLIDRGNIKISAFGMTLHGVDRGRGKDSDQLEVEFDFQPLPEKLAKLYQQGKLAVNWQLTDPNGKVRKGKWNFAANENIKFIDDIKIPGVYKLKADCDGNVSDCEITRPDLSFIGNNYGNEDEVPAIWSDFAVKGRNITLWNRVYKFGSGPLPESILVKGKELFTKAPALYINGKKVTNWKAGKTSLKKSFVIYSGSAAVDGGTIDYTTQVEFDGMIKFDWTVKGSPEISSMQLRWEQKPEFSKFLMRPQIWSTKTGKGKFLYDNSMGNSLKMLWMVSETGGFAFAPESDANWVYDSSKPIYSVDLKAGKASVDMITRKVKMPADVPYRAVFIATPSRPAPERFRAVRHNDNTYPGFRMTTHGGKAFTGVSTYCPNRRFGHHFSSARDNSHGIYGMADAMSGESPLATYFEKYWDIPGSGGYTFNWREYDLAGKVLSTRRVNSISACNFGCVVDFYALNFHKLLTHPQAGAVAAIYFDLCGRRSCSNELHGCYFADKFGRMIKRSALLSKRELVKRAVRQAHKHGKQVWIHAQREFFPMMNGLGDFFFPGEQFEAMFGRTLYPFTDEIDELVFRTEFNRNILGSGVICWTAVTSLGRATLPLKDKRRATEAMESMLLLYDVDANTVFAYTPVMAKIWNIMERYKVEAPETKFFRFDQPQELKYRADKIRVSYYLHPENRLLAAVCNTDPFRDTVEIDLGRFGKGLSSVREEYTDKDIPVVNNRITLRVPGRSFRLIGINPIKKDLWVLPCDEKPSTYGGGESVVKVNKEEKVISIVKKGKKNRIITAFIPARPGFRYDLEFESKFVAGKDITWSLQPQFNGVATGIYPRVGKKKAAGDWETIKSSIKIPHNAQGRNCYVLLLTLGGAGEEGEVFFRNIKVRESKL